MDGDEDDSCDGVWWCCVWFCVVMLCCDVMCNGVCDVAYDGVMWVVVNVVVRWNEWF